MSPCSEKLCATASRSPRLLFSFLRFPRGALVTKLTGVSVRNTFCLSLDSACFPDRHTDPEACDSASFISPNGNVSQELLCSSSLSLLSPHQSFQGYHHQEKQDVLRSRTVMTKARRARLAAAVAQAEKHLNADSAPGASFLHSQRVQELRAEEALLAASLQRLEAEKTLATARHQCESELETFRRGVAAREAAVKHLSLESQSKALRTVPDDKMWESKVVMAVSSAKKDVKESEEVQQLGAEGRGGPRTTEKELSFPTPEIVNNDGDRSKASRSTVRDNTEKSEKYLSSCSNASLSSRSTRSGGGTVRGGKARRSTALHSLKGIGEKSVLHFSRPRKDSTAIALSNASSKKLSGEGREKKSTTKRIVTAEWYSLGLLATHDADAALYASKVGKKTKVQIHRACLKQQPRSSPLRVSGSREIKKNVCDSSITSLPRRRVKCSDRLRRADKGGGLMCLRRVPSKGKNSFLLKRSPRGEREVKKNR